MTKTTHADPRAVAAACAVAAMGSWALEGCPGEELITVAREELDHFGVSFPTPWQPPPGGVSLDVADTLGAILHLLRLHDEPIEAMRYAVGLGGDTDTVAAIIGGVLSRLRTRRTSPGHLKSRSHQVWTHSPKGSAPCDRQRTADFWISDPRAVRRSAWAARCCCGSLSPHAARPGSAGWPPRR